MDRKTKIQSKIFDLVLRTRNRIHINDPNNLIFYGDSRSFLFTKHFGKTLHGSLVDQLSKRYRLTARTCPHKHTTILDFIQEYPVDKNSSKHIVLHCGVVDFSPRPLSSFKMLIASKTDNLHYDRLKEWTSEKEPFPKYSNYNNEETLSLYPISFLKNYLIPILQSYENLYWISSNNILKNWLGTYWKERPSDIDTALNNFDQTMISELKNGISLHDWNQSEIKKYTSDNIHLTRDGFQVLFSTIKNLIKPRLKNRPN